MVEEIQDITIVGAGVTGLLLAGRIHRQMPSISITVLEQESRLGGRITGRDVSLHAIIPELMHFWDQTLKIDPESPDLYELAAIHKQDAIGILVGQKVRLYERQELFSAATIKLLGNTATAKSWENLSTLPAPRRNKSLKSYDSILFSVCTRLALMSGVPDTATLSVADWQEKVFCSGPSGPEHRYLDTGLHTHSSRGDGQYRLSSCCYKEGAGLLGVNYQTGDLQE